MEDKIILNLTAKVLTPVHVGGAQEKHYSENLDYYRDKDTVYFLDEKKLMNHFGIPRFSHALATNSCLLYTSPSPRDRTRSRMPSSA